MDGEETGEDVTCDDSWNYADILWNEIQAKAVAAAFDQLSYKELVLEYNHRHEMLNKLYL